MNLLLLLALPLLWVGVRHYRKTLARHRYNRAVIEIVIRQKRDQRRGETCHYRLPALRA